VHERRPVGVAHDGGLLSKVKATVPRPGGARRCPAGASGRAGTAPRPRAPSRTQMAWSHGWQLKTYVLQLMCVHHCSALLTLNYYPLRF
jgi:hypothetical protein